VAIEDNTTWFKESNVKLLVLGEKTRVSEGLHDFVTRRLYFALGRYSPEIDRVAAHLGDINGPRGGVDKQCRIKVMLRGLKSVLSEARSNDLKAAVDIAAERVGRGVARTLERRRDATRRPGVSMAGPRESAKNGQRPKKKKLDAPAAGTGPS
jgi:putative sigma-54 modulation protein